MKKIKGLLAATAAVASIAGVSHLDVQADELKSDMEGQVSNETCQDKVSSLKDKLDMAQKDLQIASSDVATAQSQYNQVVDSHAKELAEEKNLKEEVEKLSEQERTSIGTVEKAQKDYDANIHSDEDLEKATAEQEKAKQGVSDAQANLDTRVSDLANKQKVYEKADTAKQEATTKESEIQNLLKKAQEEKNKADNALNAALLSNASGATLDKLKQDVTNANEALKQADKAVQAKKEEIAKLAPSYDVSDANIRLSKAYMDLLKKRTEDLHLTDRSKKTQAGLSIKFDQWDADKKATVISGITKDSTSSEYVKVINDLVKQAKIDEANNIYDTSKDTRPVDFSSLTKEQKEEINFFALELLNQIRAQFGTRELKATKGMFDFAQGVVGKLKYRPSRDEHGRYLGGVYKELNEEAGKVGLRVHPNPEKQAYHDTVGVGALYNKDILPTTAPYTMGDLKGLVYKGIKFMLFNRVWDELDRDAYRAFERAMDIAGLISHKQTTDMAATAVHIMVNPNPVDKEVYTVVVHTLLAGDDYIDTPDNYIWKDVNGDGLKQRNSEFFEKDKSQQKFDTTALINDPSQRTKLANDLNGLEKKRNQAMADLNTARTALANVTTVDIPSLQKAVMEADKNVATYQTQLSATSQDLVRKMQDLTLATTDLQKAKKAKSDAEGDLATAKADLDKIEKKYGRILNSIQKLKEAKDNLQDIQDNLRNKKADLNKISLQVQELVTKVNKAKAYLDEVTAKHDRLSEIYKQALGAYQASKAECDQKIPGGNQPNGVLLKPQKPIGGSVRPTYGSISSYVGLKPTHIRHSVAVSTESTSKNHSNKTLPTTGSKELNLATLGLAMLSMVGFVNRKKDEK
ncbi:SEC10/PgrA surface exclusion domain-containing protein [Streptococcus himalayensis]|uniref:Gram-positive cocci surface proteins LPxTG domain-containing protein n=1 Tax=Streptococcus himalayensis TaxID=1888195 RepID=A0A917A1V1_9STRE|nr:SEC10/PgrA surface exclusion domain-containing protein [Streptococcus himalayensis]GGE22928.1 hypothetical protein GCM10011510_00020 [Streptococcus himalayensis]